MQFGSLIKKKRSNILKHHSNFFELLPVQKYHQLKYRK